MKIGKKFLFGAAGSIAVLVLLLPALLPKERLRNLVLEETAAATGLEVRLEGVSWHWFPRPAIGLEGLHLEDHTGALLDVAQLRVSPSVSRALIGDLVLHRVVVSGVRADWQKLQAWWQQFSEEESAGGGGFKPRRIILKHLQLTPVIEQAGNLEVDLRLDDGGQLEEARVKLVEGSVRARAIRDAQGYHVELNARDWALPGTGAVGKLHGEFVLANSGVGQFLVTGGGLTAPRFGLALDTVLVRGRIHGDTLTLERIETEVWGGRLTARGQGKWRNNLSINITFNLQDIDLEKIINSYGLPASRGVLGGAGSFRVTKNGPVPEWVVDARLSGEALELSEIGLFLDRLESSLVVTDGELEYPDLVVELYQGKALGSGELHWADRSYGKGTLRVERVNMESMLQALGQPVVLGLLNGEADFFWSPDGGGSLGPVNPRIEIKGSLEVTDGFYPQVSLLDASRLLPGNKNGAGGTRFERVATGFHMHNGEIRFQDLRLNSKLLQARGNLMIAPDKRLDGVMEVGGNDALGATTVPVRISGTLDNPSVRPTTAAMVGGAVGTAILGPGLGTAVGAKAATGWDKLKGFLSGNREKQGEHR